MSEIVGSVQRVSDIIGEITAASGEQSDGIGQVNVAVNQLDQMTQQNAALVEESAAAAESLKDQANRLSQVVQIFRLEAGATVALAPAPDSTRTYQAATPPRVTQALKPSPALRSAKSASTTLPAPRTPAGVKSVPVAAAVTRTPTLAKPVSAAASDDGEWESF